MAYSEQDFDDELRERLGQEAPLPPGMDWQEMRRGIKAKVEGKPKSRRKFLFWWWPGVSVALLFLVGFAVYLLYQNSTLPVSGAVTLTNSIPSEQDRKTHASSPISTQELTGFASSIKPENAQVNHQTARISQVKTWRQRANSIFSTNSFKVTTSALRNNAFADRVNNTMWDPISNLNVEAGTRTKTLNPLAIGVGKGWDRSAPARTKAAVVAPLPRYSFVVEEELRPNLEIKGRMHADFKDEDDESGSPAKQKGFMIDMLAGTQFAASNYRGSNVANTNIRAETETPLPGHHLALGLVKPIGEDWQLRTGLTYDRYRARTDLVGTSMFDSTFQDVPVRIGIGGDTIFGTAELRVTESRKFTSYLREQRLSVPILVGRKFQLGKGLLALRGGPEFGLLMGTGGKVLMTNRRSRPLSGADFQRLNVSVRVEGELAIQISATGPFLIGRVSFSQVLGKGRLEVRRSGSSVSGGIGLRVPL